MALNNDKHHIIQERFGLIIILLILGLKAFLNDKQ